jgi:hypothetical protein
MELAVCQRYVPSQWPLPRLLPGKCALSARIPPPRKGASFASVAELVAHIDSFINSYNDDARPFIWTKSAVHQKRLKPYFAV